MVLGKLEKSKSGSLSYTKKKKWIKDLNIIPETIKLKENAEEKHPVLARMFWITPKTQATKGKTK